MPTKPPLEKLFQAKVRKKLNTLPGVWFDKLSDRSKVGIPDMFLCIKGRFVVIELKRSNKEKATPLQVHTMEQMQKAGGIAFIANPENWDEVWQDLLYLNSLPMPNTPPPHKGAAT